jgi:rhodanese-related sulfurtransferase
MPTVINRDDLQRLVRDDRAQILDVLPRPEYDEEHITGAINIPFKELNARTSAQLDRARPVITYCHDYV